MKKMLVVLFVLGLASMANALTLQLSVDGNPDPIDSQIVLLPSQTAILNIHSPDGYVIGQDKYFAAVADKGVGIVGYDGVIGQVMEGKLDTAIYGADAAANGLATLPFDGVWGFIGTSGTSGSFAAGTIIDGILFHCEREGDAVIQLWSTTDFGTYHLEDTVIIHQIPEPLTMSLLGLGGLGLLRRRHA